MSPTSPLPTAPSVAGMWQLLELRRPELTLAMAEQLLAAEPAALSPQLARAEALLQLGLLPQAAYVAHTLVAQAPELPAAFFVLARACGQQGELAAAEAAVREALRLNPYEADYHAYVAQLHYLQGRPHAANGAAESGLFIDPQHLDCLLWRALAQEQLSHPTADSTFAELFYLEPNSALAHSRRGKQLIWRCEPTAAARHLTEALRLAPTRSPELVPLLRRAVREQQWPGWLRHHQREARLGTGCGVGARLHGLLAGVVMPWYRLRSWWLTRHDPIFQHKLPTQRNLAARYYLGYLAVYLLCICCFGYLCLLMEIPAFFASIPALLISRSIIARAKAAFRNTRQA
jgi:tetratricopeptide (TPR) repeat protein